MEYEDRIKISAPEGIELEYTLAGFGSRFIAQLVDVTLRLVVLLVLLLLLEALGGGPIAGVAYLIALFLALFAYDLVFEVWGAGRTPGKRWSGLRVVMASGQPVGLGPSAVRTLLRIVDQWGTVTIAGAISIIATERNQRLGDLAAGTIVVRERRVKPAPPAPAPARSPAERIDAGLDVTAVTMSELAAVRDFLARRGTLSADARARVASALCDSLAAKVGGLTPGAVSPERLLEMIAAAKTGAPGAVGSPSAPWS